MEEVVIYLGKKCNNDCIMCNEDNVSGPNEIDFDEVCEKLQNNRPRKVIAFTGGEPTEHAEFLKILRKSKDLGYEGFTLSSNGVNFADKKFTKEVCGLGLNFISISIHGKGEVHDMITSKRSYQKAMKGVNNLLENGIEVEVDSVLIRPNADSLPEMWKEVLSYGVRNIGIADLIPEKKAKEDPEKLMLSPKERRNFFLDNLDLFKKFKIVKAVNFPRCILPYEIPENFWYISTFEKVNEWKFEGLDGEKIGRDKRKIKLCARCRFKEKCSGFRKESLKIFGEEGVLENMADNFIKQK